MCTVFVWCIIFIIVFIEGIDKLNKRDNSSYIGYIYTCELTSNVTEMGNQMLQITRN